MNAAIDNPESPIDHLRGVVPLVVPRDSPLGRVAAEIEVLASHIPPCMKERMTCPLCSQRWPCPEWAVAARRVHQVGVHLMDVVPQDLHRVVWPPADMRSA